MFNQPNPDSESLGYKPTDLDNLSDDEILRLINGTGKIRVAPHQHIAPKKHIDLDKLTGGQ